MLATSSVQGLPRVIFVEDLYKPAGVEKEMIHVHQVKVEPSWMDPIISFLKDDILPEEKLEAVKVRRKAHQFWLSEDQKLYKGSFSGPTYCAYILKQQNYCCDLGIKKRLDDAKGKLVEELPHVLWTY